MKCRIHNLNFGYTCPACDAAYAYLGRSHLVVHFNAGVKGVASTAVTLQEKAAYEHGQTYKRK